MGVKITRRGKQPTFDSIRVAAVIKGLVPGMILERTNKGIDANGKPFAPYSKRYQSFLKRGGEDPKVDLRLSGGLMNSIKPRGTYVTRDVAHVVIAPDAGTSPVWAPASSRKAFAESDWGRGRGLFGENARYSGPLRRGESTKLEKALRKRMQRTGKQSPPHNVVGYWLHHGTPTMPARPFMGLSPENWKVLNAAIAKVMWR